MKMMLLSFAGSPVCAYRIWFKSGNHEQIYKQTGNSKADSIAYIPADHEQISFIDGNSDDINQLEEILVLDNKNTVRLKDLAAVLVVGNQLAELKNINPDLDYEDFDKYNSEEIVGFVERNVVRSISVKGGKLVIEAGGSDSAYALIERKVNIIINNFNIIYSKNSPSSIGGR